MALVGLAPSVWFALAFLAVAGGADECSAVFRDTMWKQSIPDHLRGRLAGIELLSYAAGPPAGQLRSGAVAAVTGPRFSLTSGGLACAAAVVAVYVALPAFRRYTAPASTATRMPSLVTRLRPSPQDAERSPCGRPWLRPGATAAIARAESRHGAAPPLRCATAMRSGK